MSTRIEFHAAARDEFREAARWYEREREGLEGLGGEFFAAVEAVLERAARGGIPGLSGERTDTKKIVLQRFPYVLHVETNDTGLYVWAVAHGRRRPGYWRKRSRT